MTIEQQASKEAKKAVDAWATTAEPYTHTSSRDYLSGFEVGFYTGYLAAPRDKGAAVSNLVEFTRDEKAECYWREAFAPIELIAPRFNRSLKIRWQNFLLYHATRREKSALFRARAIRCEQIATPTGYETDDLGRRFYCSKAGCRWLSLKTYRLPLLLWCWMTGRSIKGRIPSWAR